MEQYEYEKECELELERSKSIASKPTARPTAHEQSRIRTINIDHGFGINHNGLNRLSLLQDTIQFGEGNHSINYNSSYNSDIDSYTADISRMSDISSRSLLTQDDVDTDSSYDLEEYFIYGKDVMDEYTSWYTGDRDGSDFHVSDVGGNYLYYTGTLCHAVSDEAPCDLTELPAGEYAWRVTGALNPNHLYVTYDFCGIRGAYSTEIIFEIDCDGECVPLQARDLDEICYNNYHEYEFRFERGDNDEEGEKPSGISKLQRPQRPTLRPRTLCTLYGSVHIETHGANELSDRDKNVIRATLAKEFIDAGKGDSSFQELVEILPSHTLPFASIPLMPSVASSILGISKLKLLSPMDIPKIHTHQIDFKVSLISENYGVDGSHKKEVEVLAKDLTTYLHHMIDNGLFISKLISRARLEGLTSMLNVKAVRLEHLIALDERSIEDEWFNSEKNLYIYSGTICICIILLLSILIISVKWFKQKGHLYQNKIKSDVKISSIDSRLKISRIHDVIGIVDKEYMVQSSR